jgi:dolichol-phosphate mannosyltransferase
MEKMLSPDAGAPPAVAASPAITSLAVVVPTLHEAANIRTVLDRVRTSLDPLRMPYEIIVVDDDSGDGTENIVHDVASQDARVRLLVRRGERGLAGAISDGWSCSQADVLGVIDADLQHPPELLPQLWERIQGGCDIAIASRYTQPDSLRSWNFARRAVSKLGILLARPVQKPSLAVKDPLSGFFLVRRRCLDGLSLQRHGFKILLEILVRGKIGRAAEVPFVFGLRQGGASKASLGTGLHYFYLLGRLWRRK